MIIMQPPLIVTIIQHLLGQRNIERRAVQAERRAADAEKRASLSELKAKRRAQEARAADRAARAESTRAEAAANRAREAEQLMGAICGMPDLNPHVRQRIRERIPSLARCSDTKLREVIARAWHNRPQIAGQTSGEQFVSLEIDRDFYTFIVVDQRFKTVLTTGQVRASQDRNLVRATSYRTGYSGTRKRTSTRKRRHAGTR